MNVAVIVPEVKLPAAACVAVIVEEPVPTIVTVLPNTVATEALLLTYENAPPLFDVGGVKVKGAFPTTFKGTLKLLNEG